MCSSSKQNTNKYPPILFLLSLSLSLSLPQGPFFLPSSFLPNTDDNPSHLTHTPLIWKYSSTTCGHPPRRGMEEEESDRVPLRGKEAGTRTLFAHGILTGVDSSRVQSTNQSRGWVGRRSLFFGKDRVYIYFREKTRLRFVSLRTYIHTHKQAYKRSIRTRIVNIIYVRLACLF